MKNTQIKMKDEWRKLNLQISYHVKVIAQFKNSGKVYDSNDEYINWVNDLTKRRDFLTTQF